MDVHLDVSRFEDGYGCLDDDHDPYRDHDGDGRDQLDSESAGLCAGGFSGKLEDDKLCILPASSDEAKQLKEVLAAIWLAPGYKVRPSSLLACYHRTQRLTFVLCM